MYQFTYWLEHFKEMQPSKAQTIVKTICLLSEKTESTCAPVGKLAESKTVIAFRRTKQLLLRGHSAQLTAAEKKALSLFEDFLEFREYSSYKFPDEPMPRLADYCKTMQMSYSYKAVLIHELASCDASGVTTDDLVKKIIAFYQDRIDHGLIAEKDDSIFAKAKVSSAAAKRIIIANPIQVLVDAKVITWNKRTGSVSFASDFCPSSKQAAEEVRTICKERLKKYYSSIKPRKEKSKKQDVVASSRKLKNLMQRLETEINATTDKATKKRLTTIYNSICCELGIAKSKPRTSKVAKSKTSVKKEIPSVYSPIDENDDRKVGALVQESFAVLEKSEFKFTKAQLKQMQSLDWSNATFKLNYPLLKPVDESKPITEQRRDHLGNGRYYSRTYTFSGVKYLVTSEWYAKSRPLFISWYNKLKSR